MSTADGPVFAHCPAVIGHRGLGKGVVAGHVENTLGSLLAAVQEGVDWVELDVTRSSDDVLVVHHNPATTDGRFLVECTADQLTRLGVPTLADALDALPGGVAVDVDVKPILEDAPLSPAAATVGMVAAVLRHEMHRRPLLVTSFDAAALLWLREEVPGLRCGLLTWVDFPLRIAVPMAAHLGMDAVGLHHRSFGPNPVEPGPVHRDPRRSIETAQRAGLEVIAWCPGPGEVAPLVAAGVDAVCVNDVPTMLPVVRGFDIPVPQV